MVYKLGYDFENPVMLSIDAVELVRKILTLMHKFLSTSCQRELIFTESTFYYSENFKEKSDHIPDAVFDKRKAIEVSHKGVHFSKKSDFLRRLFIFLKSFCFQIKYQDAIAYIFALKSSKTLRIRCFSCEIFDFAKELIAEAKFSDSQVFSSVRDDTTK